MEILGKKWTHGKEIRNENLYEIKAQQKCAKSIKKKLELVKRCYEILEQNVTDWEKSLETRGKRNVEKIQGRQHSERMKKDNGL